MILVTSKLLNSSNPLFSNQTGHPQAVRTAGVLGTSECILLDPDFLGLDVHAFPHFSCGTVCFGDPTEVECGDTGQGAQHILPGGGRLGLGAIPLTILPPPLAPHQLLLTPLTVGVEGLEYSLGATEFILTARNA